MRTGFPLDDWEACTVELRGFVSLIGPTTGRPDPQHRVPMRVHPDTRKRLNRLLVNPSMRGVGFSEFLDRAVRRAEEEINEEKA